MIKYEILINGVVTATFRTGGRARKFYDQMLVKYGHSSVIDLKCSTIYRGQLKFAILQSNRVENLANVQYILVFPEL